MAARDNLKLQLLLNAIDRVSAPLKRITAGSGATAKALKATQGELKRLEATQRSIKGLRQLEGDLAGTSSALARAQRDLGRLGDEMNAAERPSAKLIASLRKQGAEVGRLRQLEEQQRTALAAKNRALEAAGISTARLAVHERELRANVTRANAALEQQKARLTQLANAQARMNRMHSAGMKLAAHGAGAVAAGSVAARPMAAPVAAFANQEDAAMQLRASMMGAGGKASADLAKIDALAQSLGNRLPGTTADFYEMMTMLRRQGMSSQAILGGLGEATAYLGVQMKMPYAEAAQFAAKLQDATGATEKEMMGLSDVIQRTFYLGVDSDNMLNGFAKLTPALDILKRKGLDAAKTLAPLIVMADQAGMAGEQSGNAYRKVFQSAMDADKLGKANSLLKGTGINLDFSDGKGEFGGLDQMFAQLKKLEKLNTQDRLAVIKKLFGDDAETLQVVSLMISKGAEGYAQVQAKMRAQASLQERVNAQLGTLRNLWDAASGTFVNGLAALGEAVAPELKALTEWLGKAAERFQGWVKENPRLAGMLFKITAGLVGLIAVLGALALALGTVLMPFAGLQFALTTLRIAPLLGGLWSLAGKALPMLGNALLWIGRLAMANPIIAVISLLAMAAVWVWRNWDWIGPWFSKLWAGITAAASNAWAGLKHMLTSAWDGYMAYLRALTAPFRAIGGFLMDGLVGGLLGGLKRVRDTIMSVGGKVVGWLKGKLGIHSPSRVFAQLGDYTMQGFAGGLERSQGLPLGQVATLGNRMQQAGAGLAIAAAASPAIAIDNRAPLSAAPPPAASSAVYHIAVHVHGASQPQDIALAVRAEIERLERERGARGRSRLADYD
jgi:TP901 family phage tail tape measure protein